MNSTESVLYDEPADHVARITLNRAEKRNAQDTQLLYQLNAAFDRAATDDNVKVIILASSGPHFSAGHDLMEPDVLGAIYRWLHQLPIASPHKIDIPNVGYNRIALIDDEWRVEVWGDVSHLAYLN